MLKAKEMEHRGPRVIGWEHKNGSLELRTLNKSTDADAEGVLIITAISEDIIRITMKEFPYPEERPSFAILKKGGTLHSSFIIQENDIYIEARTSKLIVKISKKYCSIAYYDLQNGLLLRETLQKSKQLRHIDIYRTEFPQDEESVTVQSVDGEKMRSKQGVQVKDRSGYHATLSFLLSEEEAIYGLGQHEEGIFNYRFHYQFLYQQNLKVAIPIMVSTKGYGLFWDTNSLSTFDDTNENLVVSVDACDRLEYYFIYGPEFDNIVGGVRSLTGPLPMLPKWSYGYLQSRERYETASELIEVLERHRKQFIPVDCLVLDWNSWKEGEWGEKKLDPTRFQDPRMMMERLHYNNGKLMVSIWPNMAKGGSNHSEFERANGLLGNKSTYNAFDKSAREIYHHQAYDGLLQHGVDGWWCDCTEPFEADWNGSVKLSPFERMHANVTEQKKYLDSADLTSYSLVHSEGLFQGWRKDVPGKRVINLTRSASVGQHRYATVTWSGDIEARWSRLKKQIADGLNFTVTGNPRWTFDIGGFFVKPGAQWFWDGEYPKGNQDLGYRELYVRWLQMGVFLPMFRSHGTDTEREIWNFGEPGTPFYSAIKEGIELRYRLLPYIYTLAGMEVHKNYTSLRNLAFDFRADHAAHNISDQFMFGPALMVCPILEPHYFGPNSEVLCGVQKKRIVYLPKGQRWYDFYTNVCYEGGQRIEVETTLNHIPLFVRSGSILPIGPVMQFVDELPDAEWEIRVYTGRDAHFEIYEDTGDGYEYLAGDFSWTEIKWEEYLKKLAVSEPKGSFAKQCKNRKLKKVIISP